MAALALTAAQAGHLVAYQVRFGGAAAAIQTVGPHWYFLSAARTAVGLIALATLAALLVIALGRLASGRRLAPDSSTPFVRTLAAIYTLQLAVFFVQETAEAILGQGHLVPVPSLLLWGAIGQLPVAVMVTLALRWLGARVRPALAAIRLAPAITVEEFAWVPSAPRLRFAIATSVARRDVLTAGFSRRGPPPSS